MWLSRAFLVIMGRLQIGQIYWKVPGKCMFSTWFTTLFFWAPVLPQSVHLNRLPSSRTSFSTYFSKILRSFMPATEVVKSSGDRKKTNWEDNLLLALNDTFSCGLSNSYGSWTPGNRVGRYSLARGVHGQPQCAPSCGTYPCPVCHTADR